MMEPSDPARVSLNSAQLQDRAVKGVAWTMLHTVLAVPIIFAVNLLLARVLEPEGYGRLAYLTSLLAIAGSILALGLSSAMIQFGAKAHAAGRVSEVRQILSASQGFRLLVVAPLLTLLVLWLVDVPVALLVLAVLFGVWVPAALDGATVALYIENKSAAGARVAMLSNVLVQTGVVAAVLWVGTADSVWAARAVLSAVVIALAFLVISPVYRRAVLRPRLPRGFPPGFWRFALPTGAAALIGELALSRTEVIFLAWLSTPEQVGLFALAFGVSAHVFGPAHALTGPLIPAVAGLREVGLAHVRSAFSRTLRAAAVVVAVLSAGALPALTALVPLLYGHEYSEAAPALLVLGIAAGLSVIAGPVTAFVMARLSARRLLMANLSALGVDVALALALIPSLGLWGAVVANGCAMLVQLAILVESERRDLGMPAWAVLTMLWPVLIGSIASALTWWAVSSLHWSPVPTAVVSSGGALLALWVGLRLTNSGLEIEDRDAILRNVSVRLVPATRWGLDRVTRR
ncbi:lipopolysaccharide biosynthesis protein [Janibacter sp. GS2]|uniref:lipopolysaccharide biosynthesis protein n=1 Tax=Janibacter sp. GS2 TaxID=3442646 RepID=UPI003EBDC174